MLVVRGVDRLLPSCTCCLLLVRKSVIHSLFESRSDGLLEVLSSQPESAHVTIPVRLFSMVPELSELFGEPGLVVIVPCDGFGWETDLLTEVEI